MTILDDLTTAMNDYPETSIDLAIVNVEFPGQVLTVGDVGEFDIQVTNRGPLVLTDALFKIVGKRGTLVKGLGAADTFESENFIGRSDDIPGHNSDNPYLVHAFFEVTRSTAGDLKDLVEVTLDAWNASLSHLLNGHSDPSDLPVATYNAEVVPR